VFPFLISLVVKFNCGPDGISIRKIVVNIHAFQVGFYGQMLIKERGLAPGPAWYG
jgi:hypothetical protein